MPVAIRAAELPVMHDGYRLAAPAMLRLIEHVRGGGRFDVAALSAHERSPDDPGTPMFVTRFEDGRLMLRDGLHRATAVMLGRPSGVIEPTEVIVEDMTYAMFRTPALVAGLYAPFDPLTEVRTADFRAFRDEVRRRPTEEALAYIATNRGEYTRARRPYHDCLADFFAACSPYEGLR